MRELFLLLLTNSEGTPRNDCTEDEDDPLIMLARQAVLEAFLPRAQTLYNKRTPTHFLRPLFPLRRGFQSSPNPRGLISWLVGDNRRAKVHQEISKMLEDYDEKLTDLYDASVDAV